MAQSPIPMCRSGKTCTRNMRTKIDCIIRNTLKQNILPWWRRNVPNRIIQHRVHEPIATHIGF